MKTRCPPAVGRSGFTPPFRVRVHSYHWRRGARVSWNGTLGEQREELAKANKDDKMSGGLHGSFGLDPDLFHEVNCHVVSLQNVSAKGRGGCW